MLLTVLLLSSLLGGSHLEPQFTAFRDGPISLRGGRAQDSSSFSLGQTFGSAQRFTPGQSFTSGQPISSGQSFSSGREFSNFVDLPSQRLQQQPGFQAQAITADPDCALVTPELSSCITYTAINDAFNTANVQDTELKLTPMPTSNFDKQDIADLAYVLQETVRNLATTYSLTPETIAEGLGKIDTTRTVIGNYCPTTLLDRSCNLTRYRDATGTCNNIANPHWGGSMMATSRFLPYAYADGISVPRVAASGRPLPSPRLVSANIHRDANIHEHSITFFMVAWGQFIDHDIVLTADTPNFQCCSGPNVTNLLCVPVEIPENDHFYGRHGQRCINVVRNAPGLRANCKLGPREQFNLVTSVLDANPVYSSDPIVLDKLRTFQGGLMKSLPVFRDLGLKDLLPLQFENPDSMCLRPNSGVYCFFGGDPRTSEQTVLVTLHTLFLREHNRIATELSILNPHWTDETLFQETRHIMAATMQHITYNEFLPLVLGKAGLNEHGLTLFSNGYYDKYDPTVNPGAASGFNTAAFRFGHSLLPSTVERWSKTHNFIGTQKLSGMLQQPWDLFKPGWCDNYIIGMVNQVAQAMDDSVTSQVTNHLFERPTANFGMDLASINMQRGREHGIPSYNRFREWCGLKPIRTFEDLRGVVHNQTVHQYARIYEDPEDIDLWSGGISEIPKEGALLGPTLSCIIGRQFFNLRVGDRFWYENSGWPSSFTVEQLQEIRKANIARIICDNGDDIDTIQLRPMLLPDHKINPRLSCRSGEIPRMDLSFWRDFSGSI